MPPISLGLKITEGFALDQHSSAHWENCLHFASQQSNWPAVMLCSTAIVLE